MSSKSFDFVAKALRSVPMPDDAAIKAARAHQATLQKPTGSLGRLEEIAEFMASWQGAARPQLLHPLLVIFVGAHGIALQGSARSSAKAAEQDMKGLQNGEAPINALCELHELPLKVEPLVRPTHDFTEAPAMSAADCASAIQHGMDTVPEKCDLLLLGDMGAGNSSAAAAIACALLRRSPYLLVDGHSLKAKGLEQKAHLIWQGLQLHKRALDDPLQTLAALGGREIAAVFGAMLQARAQGVPVILDGLVPAVAALVLHTLNRKAIAHCLLGHRANDKAHQAIIKKLALEPILNLRLRLGTGTGAVLAFGIVEAALAIHNTSPTTKPRSGKGLRA